MLALEYIGNLLRTAEAIKANPKKSNRAIAKKSALTKKQYGTRDQVRTIPQLTSGAGWTAKHVECRNTRMRSKRPSRTTFSLRTEVVPFSGTEWRLG